MPRVFLSAERRNLIIVSYHVPAELLLPHLPEGLELEPIGGGPAVSLVAFEFRNTRVMGIRWPGFVNFLEWNLRFYVRTRGLGGAVGGSEEGLARRTRRAQRGEGAGMGEAGMAGTGEEFGAGERELGARRGVVFIREFVPSGVVSRIARGLYNEPYSAAAMRFAADVRGPLASVRCEVEFGGAMHALDCSAASTLSVPEESSIEHALKEHQWGFGRTRDGRTLCYEVTHPRWRICGQASVRVSVDWATLYGTEWGAMQNAAPFSTILAEGSAVTVAAATPL